MTGGAAGPDTARSCTSPTAAYGLWSIHARSGASHADVGSYPGSTPGTVGGSDEALSAACRQEGEMDQYLEEKKASQKRPAATFQRQDKKKTVYQTQQRSVAVGSSQVPSVRSPGVKKECPYCGRTHAGTECWMITGKCLKCGSSDHKIKDCPRLQQGAPAPTVAAAAPAMGRPGRPRAPARVFALAREDAEQAEHVTEGCRSRGCLGRVREALRAKFVPEHVQDRMEQEFLSLAQCSMTVLEYEARFYELSKYAPHIVADERRKTKKFVMGLKPSLRTRLVAFDHRTLDETLSAACRQEGEMEQYLEEKKASQKRPTATFQRQDKKKTVYQTQQRSVAVGSSQMKDYDAILGLDWLVEHYALVDCRRKRIVFRIPGEDEFSHPLPRNWAGKMVISAMKAMRMVNKGCDAFLASV
ncbi:hypothetical protein Taro_007552, partial [Colocasia esculenta]|nr:hypothetical protein [Colocasia esculenta]